LFPSLRYFEAIYEVRQGKEKREEMRSRREDRRKRKKKK
jgi:hypothetical protein